MRIALLSAMEEELGGFFEGMQNCRQQQLAGRQFYIGQHGPHEVILSFTRWGKVAAAITTTIAIQQFQAEQVLFLGVAGGVASGLRQGDLVIARELIQYDMDGSALPFLQKWEVPLTGKIRFGCDPFLTDTLVTAAAKYGHSHDLPEKPSVHQGLIGTADRFLASHAEKKQLLTELPDMICVEMEGASVAQVCNDYKVPLAVARVISDLADDEAHLDFPTFIVNQARPLLHGLAAEFLEELTAG